MPATPNIGQLIGASNTGYAANITTGSPLHAPRSLTTHSGSFTTTSNGQVIEGLNITDMLLIKHDNVTVRDCKMKDIENGDNRVHTGMTVEWCVIGPDTGQTGSGRGSTVRFLRDFLVRRCQIRCRIDLLHPWGGAGKIIENWFHSPLYDTTGVSNHMDPIQPPGNNPARWTSMIIQGNRFDTWPIAAGQAAGAMFGNFGIKSATSGAFNCEFNCNNTTFRDNYVDGNYSQCIYVINGDNNTSDGNPKHSGNTQFGPPTNTVIIDNIFKMRRGPGSGRETSNRYGESRFMNFGGTGGATTPSVTWGRNLDADTGVTLAAFFVTYAEGTNHSWSKITNAGPSSQYPTFYGDGPPPPPPPGIVALEVVTPAAGTYTSGSVVFVGGADAAEGDSDANYNFYNYYIQSVDPDGLSKTQLDHDVASTAGNNGFTFTPTANGVIFTDRAGVVHDEEPGEFRLIVEGERKDGSRPTAEVTVTFGTVIEPPPPGSNPTSSIEATVTMDAILHVNTSVGGVPADLVRWEMVEEVIRKFRKRHYRKDTNETVVWNAVSGFWEEL